MIKKISFLSFLLFMCLFSCSKVKKAERKIQGKWVLEEMRVIDGQGFTYYLDEVSGELDLDFEESSSIGVATFQNDFIANGQVFTTNFSGDSLELNMSENVLYIGDSQDRKPFSVILYNSDDLVLEYYDFSKYQLRKFIFTRN